MKVTVTIKNTPENKQTIKKCKELIILLYKEPVDGQFEDITSEVLEGLDTDTDKVEDLTLN